MTQKEQAMFDAFKDVKPLGNQDALEEFAKFVLLYRKCTDADSVVDRKMQVCDDDVKPSLIVAAAKRIQQVIGSSCGPNAERY